MSTPFRIGEKPDSRSGNTKPPTQTRKYFAVGSSDEEFVKASANATIPTAIVTNEGILYRQAIAYEQEHSNYYTLTANYAKQENKTGTLKIDFDSTGGTVNMKASLLTVGSYGAAPIPDFGGAIGVNGPDNDVEGTEIIIPAGKLVLTYSHPLGIITMGQIKSLMRNTGVVNEDNFLTWEPGEVLFMGASGSEGTDAEATVTYNFGCSENLINHLIGGITVAAKQGWDYAWIRFKEEVDNGKPVKQPQNIYIERVYRRKNLGLLLGFG